MRAFHTRFSLKKFRLVWTLCICLPAWLDAGVAEHPGGLKYDSSVCRKKESGIQVLRWLVVEVRLSRHVKAPSFFVRLYKSSSNKDPIRGYTCNNLTPANATETSRPPDKLPPDLFCSNKRPVWQKKYQKVRFVSIFNVQSRYSVQLLQGQNRFIQSH